MQSKIWIQLEQSPDAGLTVRWRLPESLDDVLNSTTLENFKSWLLTHHRAGNAALRAVLLMSGEQVVCRCITFAANEKKHLQKLLPFMLESQLAVDLSQVHVAHSLPKGPVSVPPEDSGKLSAMVAYTDKKQLQWRIQELESLGLEVEEVFSIPAILPATDTNWSVLLDNGICHLHVGSVLSASVEAEWLADVMDAALSETVDPAQAQAPTLTLFVANEAGNTPEQPHSLLKMLSEHEVLRASGVKFRQLQLANAWANLDINQKHAVNLRQGEFAAPLRAGKYWRQWRVPAIAAMVAITAVLVTAIVEIQINQSRFRALEARIEQRYRDVMPEGMLVDAVQQLSAQVSRRRSAGASQSMLSMLNAMLEPFESAGNLTLHRLSYSAGALAGSGYPEIQLSISAPDTTGILQLSESLSANGWSAQAQNINRVGENQQASLIIRGIRQ